MIKTHSLVYSMFFIFILLNFFQESINILGIDLRMYQIFGIFFFPLLLFFIYEKLIISVPRIIFLLYFSLVLTVSMIFAIKGAYNSQILSYMFALYSLILICTVGKILTYNEIISIFQKVAVIFIVCVCVKNVIFYKNFVLFFLSPNVHPNIYTFSQGGVNLEATWIALTCFFFKNNRIFFLVSLFISALYTSRVGFILNMVYLCWMIYHSGINIKKIILVLLLLFPLLLLLLDIPIFSYMIDRLSQSGDAEEAGSRGRLAMWIHFPAAFTNNLFGVGAGNTMNIISSIAGYNFGESNIHNSFMQQSIDFGVLGGIVYFTIVIGFLIREYKNKYSNPFAGALLGYIVASLIQFAGSESILFLLVGFYLITNFQVVEDNK